MNDLNLRTGCRYDLVSLGEVMLRLDPGETRVANAKAFQVWEGGGEYNVARNLAHCFGCKTAIVTALVDNAVGRLVQNLIRQGGVDDSLIRWVPHDGIGLVARNGLNFTERGFGARAALGCSDRAHTAVSLLAAGSVDWGRLFAGDGTRWFHTGGIFAALSGTTPGAALQAMQSARKQGAVVSYDLNYRSSLWASRGGRPAADAANRAFMAEAHVLFGAGSELEQAVAEFPNLKVAATTIRHEHSASRCDFGARAIVAGQLYEAPLRRNLEVLDRVGSGDAFASGFIYGLLSGWDAQRALDCGAALGALAMTTPGDGAMASLAEVEAAMAGANAEISR